MPVAADRLDFGPPPQPGLVPAWMLALIAHALLMAALTWGIQWDRETQAVSAVAELWASVPQEAAPQPVVAPPVVQPAPPPPPAPREEAKPEPRPEPKPEPREPDINESREREKAKQREREEARREEARREEAKRQEAERKERERRKAQAEAAEKRKEQEKLAAEKKRKAQQEEARLEKQRKENLERIAKMAGTSPTPSAGTAMQSGGPSGNWAGRVRARVKPNIVFSDDVPGNPRTDIEVRLAPDGTIVGKRVVKSSGVKSWDDAVLRALDKTEVLPRDTDGRVPSPVILEFRLRD